MCVNIYLILLSYQQSCYLQTCQELDKILVWVGVMCMKWVLSIQSVWTRYPQTAYDVRNHIYWCPMYSTHKMTIFGHFWLWCQKWWPGYNYSVQNMSWSMDILLLSSDILVRVSYQEDLRKVSFVKIESFLAELWWCNGCVHWGTQWSFWHWSIEMGEDLKNNACNEYKTQIYVDWWYFG
jgi:hypothetical protein